MHPIELNVLHANYAGGNVAKGAISSHRFILFYLCSFPGGPNRCPTCSVTRKKSPTVQKSCLKTIAFNTFAKIALECGRFGQINSCQKSNKLPNLVTLLTCFYLSTQWYMEPLSIRGWRPVSSQMVFCYIPVSPVSLTAPTRDFRSRFKCQILVANWKKYPCQFHWQRGFLALAMAVRLGWVW